MMSKLFSLTLLFWLLLCVGKVRSQSTLSDFLLTAFEDINTQGYAASVDFLSPKSYRLPVIEDLEFRFSNNEFTQDDQRYALRFRPGNPWKIRRNKALFNATKKELSIRQQLQYHENMIFRYEVAAKYLLEIKELKLEEKKYSLTKKRVEILESNLESSLFDSKDFIDAKLNQVDALNSKEEVSVSVLNVQRMISSVLQLSDINWDINDMISISGISNVADEIVSKSLPTLELELISQQIDVAKKEVELEKVDFNLGYLQTEYNPYNDKNSDYGISFGISIPIFKSNKNQIAERKLDEIELRNEYASEQHEDSVKRVVEYEYLKNLITQHQLLIEQIESLELKKLSDNLRLIEDDNPISVLDLEEGILKLEDIQLKSYTRIVEQYIEFLAAYNVISKLPLTNYLSKQLESIK